MIEVDGVSKAYGATPVLDGLDLVIERGGVTSLVGSNGAGKSTLLAIIGRLLHPDRGQVRVDGDDVATTPGPEIARRLAILRQENHLGVRLTVRELAEFGRFPHSGGRLAAADRDRDRVEAAIDQMQLADLAHRRIEHLSGGQRQRAYIAMVLAQDTDFLLLDEPLNSLDMRHAMQTMSLVRAMADELGKTVVLVLHDLNVAAAFSDRIVVMKGGEIVGDGPPDEIVRPDLLRDAFELEVPVAVIGSQPVALFFQSPSFPPSRPEHGHWRSSENSSTWVRRKLLPEGSRNDVSMP